MSRWLVAAFAILFAASAVTLAAPATLADQSARQPDSSRAAAGAPPSFDGPVGGSGLAAQQRQFDHTTFVITVGGNGSARWTFRYTRILENETERENFEAFAADFNNNESELYNTFRERARRLTAAGSNATGREMNASNFDRQAFVTTGATADQGVVRLSFQWSGFAATEGDRVTVGDVFEGGLYLGPSQWLRVEAGPDLAFASVQPDPDAQSPGGVSIDEADSVTWEGERQFPHRQPSVQLAPPGAAGNGGGGSGLGWLPMLGGALVLLLGVGAAAAWRRGVFSGGEDAGTIAAASEDDDGTAAGPTGDVQGDPAVPDEELLTDESRVLRLLEDNGGRMKQVQIVDETGWSKSKVSMLLSDMAEAEDISKLRVGRENVISLKGHEPDAAKSPFEDEREDSRDGRAS